MAILAWAVLTMVTLTSATLTIEMPQSSFCELDNIDSCGQNDCIRFDPNAKAKSPSLITVLAGGPTGPMISAYVILLWIKWEHHLPVFMEKSTKQSLSKIFSGLENMMTIEESLCNWREFGFEKIDLDLAEGLKRPEYRTGKSLILPNGDLKTSRGWKTLFKKYMDKTRKILKFLPEIEKHATRTIRAVQKKVQTKKKKDVTFVGVHARRVKNPSQPNNLEELEEDYYVDAMEHFREEYGEKNTAFLFVSDDMKWTRRNPVLKEEKNVFFVGCGEPGNFECIGKDLAILSMCNHTIESRGALGTWGTYLSGGEVYTEYGPLNFDVI